MLFLGLLALAVAPLGLLRGFAEKQLSRQLGRQVAIGAITRLDMISFAPRLRIERVRIGQAEWAGHGDMLRIDRLEARIPILPLLVGKVRPAAIRIEGAEAMLVRARGGRESWRSGTDRGEADPIDLAAIADARIRYVDHKRDRSMTARVTLDAKGLRIDGSGRVKSTPVAVNVRGAPVRPGKWPFRASLQGPALAMTIDGRTERALDVSKFDARVTARAANLTFVDAIIEAGLPATQPVRLAARVRRDRPDWAVRDLSGTIGRSDLRGHATIRKRDGRHIIEGALHAKRFDFDDLADARGRAIAAAKRQRFGPRLFPDTAIDLDNVARTDGRLILRVDQLLWPGPSPIRSLGGTLTVNRSLLEIADLRLGLAHGSLDGRIAVDQRAGAPKLIADLHLRGARLIDFVPGAAIDAPMRGRWVTTGSGRTVRAAIGRSSGRIAVVATSGVLPASTASSLGQDLGGVFKRDEEQARLRCLVVRFDARNGVATANPALIDTSRAVTRAKGTVDLADERLSLSVEGRSKRDVALRIAGAFPVGGTIKSPEIALPGGRGKVGTVLKAIGDALGGKPQPIAEAVDCIRESARALGTGSR